MKLLEKQFIFTRLLPKLLMKAHELGFEITLADGFAHDGHKENSLHYIRLAQDLNLFKNGKYLTKTEDHQLLGKYWESLSTNEYECCWGGRFQDGNHYSIAHEGRK